MRLLATLVPVLLSGAAYAQAPTPPTRAIDGPGAPTFTKIPSGNPPATAEGDFAIGPALRGAARAHGQGWRVLRGTVTQFTMDSKTSTFYPGIGRDVFGTPDPNNVKALIVETHPKDYQRTITVYVPASTRREQRRRFSSRTMGRGSASPTPCCRASSTTSSRRSACPPWWP
jgi:hypothetical protein